MFTFSNWIILDMTLDYLKYNEDYDDIFVIITGHCGTKLYSRVLMFLIYFSSPNIVLNG
jgi:hypothetical protein